MDAPAPSSDPPIRLPNAPLLAADHRHVFWLTPNGELIEIDHSSAVERIQKMSPILCHTKSVAAHLKCSVFTAFDVLELFAFVRPAQFCLPTVAGLAAALDIAVPNKLEDSPAALLTIVARLLGELAYADRSARSIARAMAESGWSWGISVLAALDQGREQTRATHSLDGLRVWNRLKEWEDAAPPPSPGNEPVTSTEILDRLDQLLGSEAENRSEQSTYATDAGLAFLPKEHPEHPKAIIAEAGTGVGKTLGYIAPASVWAEKNEAPVWISTFTRNLQRQLDRELDKLYPDPATKALRAVIRKGRENYMCLLNFEDAIAQSQGLDRVTLGLTARWITATRDGDMVGGDFPAWLGDLLGRRRTIDLTDTRGECIYAACQHYGRCFIEKSVRRARRARLVVANHAVVMLQLALGAEGEGPTRYVFDEGHHLFDAADSAFSAHLTGGEAAELRRWILGAEGRRASRARGLKARMEDILGDDESSREYLDDILAQARSLPNHGWLQRLSDGMPHGVAEQFFYLVRQQVYARDPNSNTPFGLEAAAAPPLPEILAHASAFTDRLGGLLRPAQSLVAALLTRLENEAEELETSARQRIEAVARSLERRCVLQVTAWRGMLDALAGETPPEFIDFFEVERISGRDFDIGMHRHWRDPMKPFAGYMARTAQGVAVTSATLRDGTGNDDLDWQAADLRTGVRHLPGGGERSLLPSPFDYAVQTRILVVSDINKNDIGQLASAYRELILASDGGALGLFTSIARLKGVYERLVADAKLDHLHLLAQHIDPLDTGTLVDIFRTETDTCLLGTDAVRDGVDVPGRSLRLMIYDRVPWPRPTILHKARKTLYSRELEGGNFDDLITRLRLKQAYGRLVRRADDKGVFVMLDKAMPSRMRGAFPDGMDVHRVGLAEAVHITREFLEGS